MRNLFEIISARRTRLIFTILFVAILIICTINAEFVLYRYAISNDQCAWREIPGNDSVFVITDVVPGGVTDKAGIRNGDRLLKLNGKKFSTNYFDTTAVYPMLIVNAIPKGEYATYLIQRDGNQFEAKVEMLKVFDFVYAANYLFGVVFLLVGYIVVMTKPSGKTQRMFAYFTMSLMLMFGLSTLDLTRYRFSLYLYVTIITLSGLARVFGPSIIINFFYFFPVYKKTKSNKIILISLAVLNGLIVLYSVIFSRQLTYLALSIRVGDIYIIRTLIQNLVYVYFIAGLGIFIYRSFTLVQKERRKPLVPIVICSIIGIAAYIFTIQVNLTNVFTIFLSPQNLLQYILIILIPLSFGYSIFKYRIMDFKLFLKKSLIYGIITATLAAFYVLLVFIAGELLGNVIGEDKRAPVSILAIIIIAFVFDPLKRFVQDYVDRFFYRDKPDYQKILLDFSKTLPLQTDQNQILNSVADTITATMHVDKIAVMLFDDSGHSLVSRNIPEDFLRFNGQYERLRSYLERSKEPQSISVLKEEYVKDIKREDLEFFSAAGFEMAVPVMLHERLIGLINAGKKLSEKDYSQEDLNLLMTVANQTAIAIENSRLYDKEKSFYQIQHELELASQIQMEWLPKCDPYIEGYEICGVTKPAKIVGGDYFDYIDIDENKLAICLGDVSGKGLHAALLLANLQAILRSQTPHTASPAENLEQTNKLLYSRTSDNMFVTMFYSVLDKRSSTLHYTNAGHNYPVLFRDSGELVELKTGGLILGIDYDTKYAKDKITMKPNDILMIYSDGITEQFNPRGYLFGEGRLTELVKNNQHLSASNLSNLIFENINSFKENMESDDDMTLIILKKL